jgi:hypothetical protein
MLIANPIYDTVFKNLMENSDIARGIISEIIGETIEHLEFKTRENVLKLEDRLTFYHLDFIAKIKKEDGGYKTVLIELRKSSTPTDIIRFRRYLGEQYKKEEEITGKHGVMVKEPLPIISIYILGYYLSRTLPGVIRVNRLYIDVLEGKEVKERNEFIECLIHDSYVIQIPALRLQMKTRLEYILSIFKQEKFIDDDHHLKSYDYEVEDDLMKKILKQLERAAANKELLQQLDLEEMALREFESTIGRLEKELEQKDKALEEKEKYIKELLKKLGKE